MSSGERAGRFRERRYQPEAARGLGVRLKVALVSAAVVATAAAFAPAAGAHDLTGGWSIECNRNNGVACITSTDGRWATTHSHMHTIPSAINYICAGARNTDGSWKNSTRCFDWNTTHRADVSYQSLSVSNFAGWWQGGGASNWIRVEAHLT